MPAQIEPIDHTADIGLIVRAGTAEEAFSAVAEAMFDYMLDRNSLAESRQETVRVTGDDWGDLLVVWLEELLYLFESRQFAVRRCQICDLAPAHLEADIWGETLDRSRHETRLHIKAVTYHQLRAEQTEDGFLVEVIFDI